ncbi:MAG TPA: PAS domain-containing sensor histidine kinase, partial [Sphingobacteriaceae bacterium]
DAVIVIDKDDMVLEWNPKAEEIFGFSHAEVIGKRLVDTIIPPQYRQAHREGMKRFLDTGEGPVLNRTIEITALHKDRREFYINLSISSVRVDDEWLFIAFLSDISGRKNIESRLIRKEAELMQSRVLDEKKDEFLGIASHELKTPLTTVKAYLQLALLEASRTQPDSRIVGFLEKANVNTEKLSYLINELLDVSKIRSGKLELSRERVNLNGYLQNLLESLQFITPTHRIVFTGESPGCMVEIDPLRMEQVITNFISNAAKYSPGKDLIRVACSCANGHAVISVQDFGIGIPEDQLPNLFNRFFRVQDIASGFSGLGIGLFIAREIVTRHGGTIRVESRPDEGSTFFISIPLSPDQDAI